MFLFYERSFTWGSYLPCFLSRLKVTVWEVLLRLHLSLQFANSSSNQMLRSWLCCQDANQNHQSRTGFFPLMKLLQNAHLKDGCIDHKASSYEFHKCNMKWMLNLKPGLVKNIRAFNEDVKLWDVGPHCLTWTSNLPLTTLLAILLF